MKQREMPRFGHLRIPQSGGRNEKLVHARFYTYDFTRLVAMIAFTLTIAVKIVYSVLSGSIL
ncbi:hypothetical protein GOB07_06940 [Sinorhizobium meliloti]|nr:hypothetical protein [Sinorhizobium meliloti]RVG80077.1 hypothetical protein CN223_06250 [Sinorhizobium meliloti]